MKETERKVKTSKRNFIIALILLLTTNLVMGIVLSTMARVSIQEQIEGRMLDIANIAVVQLDGDELKTLTKDSKGTEAYDHVLKTLRSFQETIELDYIYGIKPEEDGTFTFTVDPDPDHPGEFGEEIRTTDALKNAAKGKADVDRVAYTDAWGRFYSAYSPVFDSKHQVVGIVGVDFNANWYDAALNSNIVAAVILTIASMVVGVILAWFLMSQNRKQFEATQEHLRQLDRETQRLDHLIMETSIKKLEFLPNSDSELLKTLASGEIEQKPVHSEYEELKESIDTVSRKLKKYLTYISSEVNTDPITGVCNKAAYKQKTEQTDEAIREGSAAFTVAFFDINELKKTYTYFGFEAGDKLMFECAKILRGVFGKEQVYHVTGDEFIVILDGKTAEDMKKLLSDFDEELKKYNREHEMDNRLSVAKGAAEFDPKNHQNYRKVFVEAHAACDEDKAAYYASKKVSDF